MLYSGKNLEEALNIASEAEYTPVEELTYYVVNQNDEKVEIEVYTIVDVIEFARNYVIDGINALGFDARVNPTLKDDIINLKIESDRNPIIIGKNGKSLQKFVLTLRYFLFMIRRACVYHKRAVDLLG